MEPLIAHRSALRERTHEIQHSYERVDRHSKDVCVQRYFPDAIILGGQFESKPAIHGGNERQRIQLKRSGWVAQLVGYYGHQVTSLLWTEVEQSDQYIVTICNVRQMLKLHLLRCCPNSMLSGHGNGQEDCPTIAAIPGNTFPSRYSSMAPPPVLT